jgi:hypothetical protein
LSKNGGVSKIRRKYELYSIITKYQQDDKGKMKSFKEGELILWIMPKVTKIKGEKFRLPWKGHYKMQEKFNNNTM